MKRTLTAVLAAGILVAGAFAVTALVGGVATAQEEPAEHPAPPDLPRAGELVDQVLADLVAEDVISQQQADAVAEALSARLEEVKEELGEWREERREWRREHRGRIFRLGALLEDGVIDADELAELGEDHPFNDPDGPAAEYLDDGQLTAEEVRAIVQALREQHRLEHEEQNQGDGA